MNTGDPLSPLQLPMGLPERIQITAIRSPLWRSFESPTAIQSK